MWRKVNDFMGKAFKVFDFKLFYFHYFSYGGFFLYRLARSRRFIAWNTHTKAHFSRRQICHRQAPCQLLRLLVANESRLTHPTLQCH
jgi:hypothetical protein